MDDLISRQSAIDAVKGRFSMPVDNLIVEVIGALPSAQPTIDAVEVVRCKDCEYYMNDAKNCWNDMINADMIIEPDWFCANAVRKDYDDCRN